MIKIFPSVLAADMLRIGEEIERMLAAGADGLHMDMMDAQLDGMNLSEDARSSIYWDPCRVFEAGSKTIVDIKYYPNEDAVISDISFRFCILRPSDKERQIECSPDFTGALYEKDGLVITMADWNGNWWTANEYPIPALNVGNHGKTAISIDLQDIAMNASDDKFNGVVYDDHYDGYVSAMIGLIYHFKDHYGDRRFMDINWTDADELARMNRNINDLRDQLRNTKPRVEYRDEYHYIDVLQTTVSFEIDKYNITKIQKKNVAEVAKYLENHPEVNLVVCGYADVETAYPEYNLKLSENRAKAVYNMLVKDFNVQPDRLRIDFKGDTVQPYGLKNEWNRVVIFVTEPNNK